MVAYTVLSCDIYCEFRSEFQSILRQRRLRHNMCTEQMRSMICYVSASSLHNLYSVESANNKRGVRAQSFFCMSANTLQRRKFHFFHITFWLMLNGRGVREARNSIRGPCAFAELVVPNLRLSSNCHFQDCKKRNRMGLVCGKQAAAAAAAKKKNKQISVAFTHVADYRNLQRLIMYISNWTSRDRKWSAQLSSWM